MKKILGIVVVIVLVGLVILFILGNKFDLGLFGNGTSLATNTEEQAQESEPSVEEKQEEGNKGDTAETTATLSETIETITVRIEQDKVYVGDIEYVNAEDLKNYLDGVNTDDTVFELYEEQSILATHEWVVEVFNDLGISFVTVTEE